MAHSVKFAFTQRVVAEVVRHLTSLLGVRKPIADPGTGKSIEGQNEDSIKSMKIHTCSAGIGADRLVSKDLVWSCVKPRSKHIHGPTTMSQLSNMALQASTAQ